MTMTVIRSTSVKLFVLSWLVALGAGASIREPASGLYENASETPLVALLDSAKRAIDIEIYQMGDPLVFKAILAAQADGVKVRILQEPNPVGENCGIFDPPNKSTDDDKCSKLKEFRQKVVANGGVYAPFNKRLCGGATTGCVQHGKMVIVDAKAALLSTGNFNSTNLCNKKENPDKCNRDYSYIVRYAPAIQILGQIFERDLAGRPYNLQSILSRAGAADLSVSPYSFSPIAALINSAKSSIIIQEQYLKDPKMNDLLKAAAKAGVKVRVNVASVCAFGAPSETDVKKWTATYSAFEAVGIKVRAFTRKVKVGGLDGYLHAKAIVVDGKTAWVGSINGSTQSIGSNREFGVFFDGERDVKRLLTFMDGDFKHPGGESWQDSLDCKNDKVAI